MAQRPEELIWPGTNIRFFFRDATFYASAEVAQLLTEAGFQKLCWAQTLSAPPEEMTYVEALRPGRGDGAFVVVRGVRV
jgi:hypothetical protein